MGVSGVLLQVLESHLPTASDNHETSILILSGISYDAAEALTHYEHGSQKYYFPYTNYFAIKQPSWTSFCMV